MKRIVVFLAALLAYAGLALGAININSATKEQLEKLDGIGPVKAQAIIDYRQKNGPFKKLEDIKNVPGVGDATYEKIRKDIALSGRSTDVKDEKAEPKKVDTKKADEKKADTKKADEKKADTKKAEEKKADTKKAEEKKADTKKAEEKKADTKKAEEKKADTKKADEKKADSKKTDAKKAEEKKAEEKKADEKKK